MRTASGLVLGVLLVLAACRPDSDLLDSPGTQIEFSTDTLFFDTVFTTVGSSTRQMVIYNRNKKDIQISRIALKGQTQAVFRFNVDGISGPQINNLIIGAGDSALVFAEVTVDPVPGKMPFVLEDELEFTVNGQKQSVLLVAWGQNAFFIRNRFVACDTTWTRDLPIVVYDSVGVLPGCSLTVEAGTRVYFHKNSEMAVLGTLLVNGALGDSVLFRSDRLEKIYIDEPGQWDGIHFYVGSINNRINYAVIENAFIGLRVDSLPADGSNNPNLILSNSIIRYHEVAGILGFTARIAALNNLIYFCGVYGMAGLIGGEYELYHNTIGNYAVLLSSIRQTPSALFADNLKVGEVRFTGPLQLTAVNNIFWGSLKNEFGINLDGGTTPSLNLAYNILRSENASFDVNNNRRNAEPRFVDRDKHNYRPDSLSPALNNGIFISGEPLLEKDLDGNFRQNPPEIGCYERP